MWQEYVNYKYLTYYKYPLNVLVSDIEEKYGSLKECEEKMSMMPEPMLLKHLLQRIAMKKQSGCGCQMKQKMMDKQKEKLMLFMKALYKLYLQLPEILRKKITFNIFINKPRVVVKLAKVKAKMHEEWLKEYATLQYMLREYVISLAIPGGIYGKQMKNKMMKIWVGAGE